MPNKDELFNSQLEPSVGQLKDQSMASNVTLRMELLKDIESNVEKVVREKLQQKDSGVVEPKTFSNKMRWAAEGLDKLLYWSDIDFKILEKNEEEEKEIEEKLSE